MNDLEKYDNQTARQDLVNMEALPESSSEPPKFIAGILRRWYIAFLTLVVVGAIGLPLIWLYIERTYNVVGAIRIAPILADILTDKRDQGEISDYQSFMNTQAEMITSSRVIQRVADNLQGRNLAFFENEPTGLKAKFKQLTEGTTIKPEPTTLLKQALSNQVIVVNAEKGTELIKIAMESTQSQEAMQIVDAFINAYMAVGVDRSTQDENKKLSVLEEERKLRENEMENLRQSIFRMAQEYGMDTLSSRQDMMLRHVSSLLSRLTEIEAARIKIEAQVLILERTKEEPIAPDELLRMRQNYISGDPSVVIFARNIAEIDRSLILAEETLTPSNPEIKFQSNLLETMKARLEEVKNEASNEFDALLAEETAKASDARLISARTELEHIQAYEERLKETIEKEDAETIRLGQLNLTIQDLQDKLDMSKVMYDAVLQRVQNLELQQKRPARISVHYYADIAGSRDKRFKYSAALILGGLVFGMWLAYLRDKADLRLRTPEDVAKRIGIRIIGTTTSLNTVKPALLPEQIIGDYQTIRANLGFLDGEGIPKKLVVTSPGMKEGKTTFTINLATSMAEAGKKVLLIDGDLRKPDVARLLNLPKDSRGLQDVLSGIQFERAVYSITSTGLDVLAADFRDAGNAYELLALSSTAQRINQIGEQYDHVIIDTPPVLAFPDALMWAKIGDAVILTSFAGQTTLPDLREAKERLMQINVRILGTVVSSVDVEHSYYRQDYGYYAQSARARTSRKKPLKSKPLKPD